VERTGAAAAHGGGMILLDLYQSRCWIFVLILSLCTDHP
jgi:hypothetical protein